MQQGNANDARRGRHRQGSGGRSGPGRRGGVQHIVADNYFELYVNGKLVGVDPVPYTPFNSAIVRFRAKQPYTYALKLVDWEEKLGLGMEWMPNHDWWPGDGG